MSTDIQMTLAEAVDAALSGQNMVIRCPAHDDKEPSLSVGPGKTQPVVLHCHAGCAPDDICAAGSLIWSDVCRPLDETAVADSVWTPRGNASHVYPYRLANGHVEFEVLRVPQEGGGKTFLQRRFDPTAQKFSWKLGDAQRVLYRLPEIISAVESGQTIHIVEGEKDVHSLLALGLVATTNPGGAGKWQPQYTETLAGANVIICSDTNTVGRAHARAVRESLLAANCTVTVIEPPGNRKDVTDHLVHGGAMESMLVVTPEHETERERFGVDVLDIITRKVGEIVYVIPKTLARSERLLVTGFEGQGKSTLLRQIAVQVAGGIHPFSLGPMEPQKVLVIDAENHPNQTLESWQQLVGLAAYHGDGVEQGMLTILEEWDNSELDLAGREGAAWLHERIYGYMPDLVIMGPLTNMVGRDLKDDEPVRRLRNAINSARSISGSAFILEHHAPHKGPNDRERQVRPYGSSMFLKWPDFGYGLKPEVDNDGVYEWARTRWPRVRSRVWPERLRAGQPNTTEWPWLDAGPAL